MVDVLGIDEFIDISEKSKFPVQELFDSLVQYEAVVNTNNFSITKEIDIIDNCCYYQHGIVASFTFKPWED